MRTDARTWKPRSLGAAAASALLLAALAAGCETAPPGGGVLNPAPGESAGGDKAAVRDDLRIPDPNPKGREPVAESAPSSPASTGTTAGTGGGGGGQAVPGPGSTGTPRSPQ
jgi:hypothetical protein